jgi:hypothetical protein
MGRCRHAAVSIAEPGAFEDGYGTANDRHAMLLGGDDIVVIEGTSAELTILAERIIALLDREADGH